MTLEVQPVPIDLKPKLSTETLLRSLCRTYKQHVTLLTTDIARLQLILWTQKNRQQEIPILFLKLIELITSTSPLNVCFSQEERSGGLGESFSTTLP